MSERIRKARLNAGLTLEQMVRLAGFANVNPKEYGWALENPDKHGRGGIRFGSLYALAAALQVEIIDLLPPVDEVLAAGGVAPAERTALEVADA